MEFMGVNLLCIFLAALATMVVGFVWYSPMLFARPWTVAMGYDPDDKAKMDELQKGAGPIYGLALLASLLSAFILGKVIFGLTVNTPLYGMKVGFGIWLGFVATVQLTDMLFGKRPLKLFLINTGYQLVCYLAMGAIIGAFQR
jgi:hypothetical protein